MKCQMCDHCWIINERSLYGAGHTGNEHVLFTSLGSHSSLALSLKLWLTTH